ncbi:hypothetical protein EVAR_28043_1 [Eumeta japonica]|uniref:CHK kinase-like domain-containing protein n=1 Tax=Eumeta variegata TaxID=151549 RepID=A0A4C1W8H4_EUMVA|nr:hypothetical protein EVAR_28043_1 [Eumeta japonica]
MDVCDVVRSVENKLFNVYCKRGYTNINIEIENGSELGDGYVALVLRALVTGEKNGEESKKNIIVKCAPKALEVRKVMPITQLFVREAFFYSNILPRYEKIQNDAGLSQDMKCEFPHCIDVCDDYLEEHVALENLKAKGYELCKQIDYEHAEKAFEILGKFHALSLIFEKRHKGEFEYCVSQSNEIFFNNLDEYNCSGLCIFLEKAKSKFINCIVDEDHRKAVAKALRDDFYKMMQKFCSSGKIKVIVHGDFWLNNMFFKYQDGVPLKALPIDFQIIRYQSPVNDLLYFTGGSSDASLRRNHFWKLFDVYYDSFKEFINLCGYDVENICSYDDMKKELYNQALYGIISGVFTLPFFTSDEVVKPHEMFHGNYPNSFLVDNETYKRRVNDLVTDFITWNFLE